MKKLSLLFLSLFALSVFLAAQQPKGRKSIRFYDRFANRDITLRNVETINSPALEFSPVFYQNGLVYVSSRQKNGPVDEAIGETFFQLFYSEFDPNDNPTRPQPFSVEINSQLHEGPVSFDRTGNKLYFSRNNQKAGMSKADSKGRVQMKLYEADKGYFDWENLRELPFNGDEFSCMHPALSPDSKKLFFASDMPGGYGGMDLYVVERRGAAWMPPINLGPDINTNKNEVFPFIHESGALFFASDGHAGYGGLDLFMIDLSLPDWSEVVNLGPPFNSTQDDLSLILLPNGKRGFFASNREGGAGKDDIYLFEAPGGIKGIKPPQPVEVPLAVTDQRSGRPLSGVSVRVFTQSGDGYLDDEALYDLELLPSASLTDNYELRMVRKKEDELGVPKQFTGPDGRSLLELDAGRKYLILVSKAGYTSEEITYTTDNKGGLQRPVELALEPSNCLTLNGVVLSDGVERRIPNATVRLLNECTGAEEVVQANVNGVFEACLEKGCDYLLTGEKEGFFSGSNRVSTIRVRGSRSLDAELRLTARSDEALREPIREGTVIVLENIYYDFNKSYIRSGEARDLEALAKLMKLYPSMEIELIAHTDCRGDEDYNLALSLRRAESAKEFLVQRGVEPGRIRSVGFGETRPRNDCDCDTGLNCSEEAHQYNRRTEVKVIRMDESAEIEFQDGEFYPKERKH